MVSSARSSDRLVKPENFTLGMQIEVTEKYVWMESNIICQ